MQEALGAQNFSIFVKGLFFIFYKVCRIFPVSIKSHDRNRLGVAKKDAHSGEYSLQVKRKTHPEGMGCQSGG